MRATFRKKGENALFHSRNAGGRRVFLGTNIGSIRKAKLNFQLFLLGRHLPASENKFQSVNSTERTKIQSITKSFSNKIIFFLELDLARLQDHRIWRTLILGEKKDSPRFSTSFQRLYRERNISWREKDLYFSQIGSNPSTKSSNSTDSDPSQEETLAQIFLPSSTPRVREKARERKKRGKDRGSG